MSHDQCLGSFLGTIGQDPIVSNINQVYVDILWLFYIKSRSILKLPLNRLVIFLKSWMLISYFPNSTSSYLTSCQFSLFIAYIGQELMDFLLLSSNLLLSIMKFVAVKTRWSATYPAPDWLSGWKMIQVPQFKLQRGKSLTQLQGSSDWQDKMYKTTFTLRYVGILCGYFP